MGNCLVHCYKRKDDLLQDHFDDGISSDDPPQSSTHHTVHCRDYSQTRSHCFRQHTQVPVCSISHMQRSTTVSSQPGAVTATPIRNNITVEQNKRHSGNNVIAISRCGPSTSDTQTETQYWSEICMQQNNQLSTNIGSLRQAPEPLLSQQTITLEQNDHLSCGVPITGLPQKWLAKYGDCKCCTSPDTVDYDELAASPNLSEFQTTINAGLCKGYTHTETKHEGDRNEQSECCGKTMGESFASHEPMDVDISDAESPGKEKHFQ